MDNRSVIAKLLWNIAVNIQTSRKQHVVKEKMIPHIIESLLFFTLIVLVLLLYLLYICRPLLLCPRP